MKFRRGLAVVGLALLAAACTSGGPATGRTTTSTNRPLPTTTTSPLPTVLTRVTPAGWVPVEFGDAQVSVPSDWQVGYDDGCPLADAPGAIFVGNRDEATCAPAAGAGLQYVTIWPFPQSSPGVAPPEQVINGIPVFGRWSSAGFGDYEVPALGVQVIVHEKQALAVLATLTRSPATVALAPGPAPAVPKTWRWVAAGSVRVAVPANWPTSTSEVEGPACERGTVVASQDEVVLDSDASSGAAFHCAAIRSLLSVPRSPTEGVVVDLHPQQGYWPPSSALGGCLPLHHLTACLYTRAPTLQSDRMAELDVLFVQLTVPGHAGHELLEIGLAGNGMVARTILYSLTAA